MPPSASPINCSDFSSPANAQRGIIIVVNLYEESAFAIKCAGPSTITSAPATPSSSSSSTPPPSSTAQIGHRQEFQQILEDKFDTASQIDSVLVLFICPMPSITATTGAADDDVEVSDCFGSAFSTM
ncbi:hypothetical protein RHGRI_011752 [Rhododendron griersonianum]|uniref:Uncharacterized protein n=1 Tax=Rhododendron griersonianum TaxID=479676 RepID=A0AAV6KNK7_9ERIC|nr:hypothetical protein RHGRI_011752 [Rhododendron griersonianum]